MKIATCILALALVSVTMPVTAQNYKELAKERKEIRKEAKKELNEKASKAAQKEAKKMEKAGWGSAPGALPLERQFDRSYLMQMEYDEEGFPKYLMAEGMSIGENYDAAKVSSREIAMQNLVGMIQSQVTGIVENSVSNEQLSAEQAASVVKTITESRNLISQSIGRVITVVEVYRTLKNKNKEVLTRIAYNSQMANAAAKKAVYQGLKDDSEELRGKLDEIMGW